MRDYLPNEFDFRIDCVRWGWEHINELIEGRWPAVRESGYTDGGIPSRRGVRRAPFETACLVAAELRIRARKCGLDGYLVEERYIQGHSEAEIAKLRHMDEVAVRRRINKVLWYSASGWEQRAETYDEWKTRSSNRAKGGVRA